MSAAGTLKRTDLKVTSISGELDGLSTPAKVTASKADLPASSTFVVVPGAVHSYFGDYGVHALPLHAATGIPLVTTFYGADMSALVRAHRWRRAYGRLFQTAGIILVEGPYMRDRLVELGCPPERVAIHHIGIDVPADEMDRYTNAIREHGCEFIDDAGAVAVKFRMPGGGSVAEIAPFGWHFRAEV